MSMKSPLEIISSKANLKLSLRELLLGPVNQNITTKCRYTVINFGSKNQCKSSKILRKQRYKCMKLNGTKL